MFSVPAVRRADDADPRALRQRRDLVDELDVARPDEHRHDRHAAADERLGLVGVERRRRDEVVVEPVEPLGQLVEERALGLDQAGELAVQALGVVAGVGGRALGEEDADLLARPLALRGRGVGGGRDLVGREAGLGGAPEHLRDDAAERLRPAAVDGPIGDDGPGAVPARDVAVVGEAAVDGADRVRVDAQRRAELANGREALAGLEPAGLDLVGELPVDLGRDGDVGVALDVEVRSARRRRTVGWYVGPSYLLT